MSKFVHMELNTSDPNGAKKFYGKLFGWKFEDMTMGDGSVYTMVASAEGPIGGIQKSPMPEVPTHWLAYAGVASVGQAIKTVKKLGGSVVVGRTEVPGMGALAVFTDPQGGVFAAWEPAPMATASASASSKPAKKAAAKKQPAKKAAKKTNGAQKASKQPAKAAKQPAKKATKKATKRRPRP